MRVLRLYGVPLVAATVAATGVTTLIPEPWWVVNEGWEYLLVYFGGFLLAFVWIIYRLHLEIVYLSLKPDITVHSDMIVDCLAAYPFVNDDNKYEAWQADAGGCIHEVTHRFKLDMEERLTGRFGKKWTSKMTDAAIEQRSIGPVQGGYNAETEFPHRLRQALDLLVEFEAALRDRPSWRSSLHT